MKNILYGVALLACGLLGFWAAKAWFEQKQATTSRAKATVLLERVEKVMKLVTVEGNFTEYYDETMDRNIVLYLPLPSTWRFSKTAYLEVTGKVMVGYNLEQVEVVVDSLNRRLILRNLPEAEILSIDHELRYKNLEESFFNGFTPEDYTQLNKNAKTVLMEKAQESGLIAQAAEQGNQMLDVIRFMAEGVGWTVVVEGEAVDELLQ